MRFWLPVRDRLYDFYRSADIKRLGTTGLKHQNKEEKLLFKAKI